MQFISTLAVTATFLAAAFTSSNSVAADISPEQRAQIEAEVMAVLDEFIHTFSAKDAQGHVDTYHFPHFRLARGEMRVWEDAAAAAQANKNTFKTLPETGWDRSIWIHRRIVTMGENKVHVDTRFRRLREDGSEVGTFDSLYVLIKQNGRWGIKLRSSFA